jgi:hypothetical protein
LQRPISAGQANSGFDGRIGKFGIGPIISPDKACIVEEYGRIFGQKSKLIRPFPLPKASQLFASNQTQCGLSNGID